MFKAGPLTRLRLPQPGDAGGGSAGPDSSTRWSCSLSAAWRSGLERRFYDGHDRKIDGSTPTLASLLRSWKRFFATIICAWWNLTSSKLKKSEAILQRKTRIQVQLLSDSGLVLCIAPPSLSHDRRIEMKKSNTKHRIG